ncbi:MAG: hypothetical protein IPK16_22700 [Anaerolineales bacterium]|nr:hypothetical protein [Anaerolineales bacterium]
MAVTGITLFAIGRFALISFDELASWRERFVVPVGDQTVNLLGHGFFIQYPARERTDPGFAIAPEVLQIVDQARQAADREAIHLGVLVNSTNCMRSISYTRSIRNFPQVRLRELAQLA